jgi:hypothetical protein
MYTIHGTFTSGTVDLTSHTVYQSLNFQDTRDDKTGIYRRVLNTELLFVGAAYQEIIAERDLGTCDIPIQIKYNGVTKYNANIKLNTSATNINELLCTITAKLDSNDTYTCFLQEYDQEINILQDTTRHSVKPFFGTIEVKFIIEPAPRTPPPWPLDNPRTASSSIYTAAQGWAVVKNQLDGVTLVSLTPMPTYRAEIDIATTYIREFVAGSTTPPGDGWLTVSGGFARRPSSVYNASKSVTLDQGQNQIIQVYDVVGLSGNFLSTPIPNGVRLSDIFSIYTPCSLSVVSDFYGINPDGTAPSNTPYNEAAENLQDFLLFQKSDVKRSTASNPATVGRTSIKKILEALQVMHNIRYGIEGSTLRIEHVSYFTQATGLNLTVAPFSNYIDGKISTTYDNGDAAKSERWEFMETVSPIFTGTPIRYDNECLLADAPSEVVYTANEMNGDVLYIQANPDRVDDKGFVPIAAYRNGEDYYLVNETNVTDFNTYPNGHLAWENLLAHYHTYDRLYPTGTMNGDPVTFDSSRRRKVGEPLEIILSNASYWDVFSAGDSVETVIGVGEVTRAGYETLTCQLSLNVRY